MSNPYLDPTTGILRNLLGCTTDADLSRAEGEIVAARQHQLRTNRIEGRYDLDHLQAFHRHLFGDVYPWAGDLRTVDIARTVPFARWEHVQSYLDSVFDHLAAEDHRRGLDRDAFVLRLAHHLGEVNAVHPFREGNGRTQRAFFRQLAHDAGWSLHWSRIEPQENNTASEASLLGNQRPLELLIAKLVDPASDASI